MALQSCLKFLEGMFLFLVDFLQSFCRMLCAVAFYKKPQRTTFCKNFAKNLREIKTYLPRISSSSAMPLCFSVSKINLQETTSLKISGTNRNDQLCIVSKQVKN